jgi:hypothetical protein
MSKSRHCAVALSFFVQTLASLQEGILLPKLLSTKQLVQYRVVVQIRIGALMMGNSTGGRQQVEVILTGHLALSAEALFIKIPAYVHQRRMFPSPNSLIWKLKPLFFSCSVSESICLRRFRCA